MSLPAYVTLDTAGAQYWQWAGPGHADNRAPQVGVGANSNLHEAACDYSGSSFSVDLNFNDSQSHRVAFYLLDYDYRNRAQTVRISNGDTGAVLDTHTVSGFQNGQYLVYTLSGHVKITFTNAAGSLNAVLSAILFDPPAPLTGTTSTWAGVDRTTLGSWTGVYGTQGYDVIGGSESLPGYASVIITGAQYWPWAASTTDPKQLQTAPGSANRVAACDYSNNPTFTIEVKLTDGQQHQLSLYLLDYDHRNRSEVLQIKDAVTGASLGIGSGNFTDFVSGEYVRLNVSGDIRITVSNAGGNSLNEVVSGLFIDPAPVAGASFVKTDATTQGNYPGVYGSDGYEILGVGGNGGSSYASVFFPSDIKSYVWNASTTEPRVLQDPGMSNRVAACYYSNDTSFTFNLDVFDRNTHPIALYFLDYDYRNRAETVQISNARTGAVLDTESLSNFTQGKYLVWNLSGDLNITITKAGGLNEVLSGIFFG